MVNVKKFLHPDLGFNFQTIQFLPDYTPSEGSRVL